jgi:hypothetical protein
MEKGVISILFLIVILSPLVIALEEKNINPTSENSIENNLSSEINNIDSKLSDKIPSNLQPSAKLLFNLNEDISFNKLIIMILVLIGMIIILKDAAVSMFPDKLAEVWLGSIFFSLFLAASGSIKFGVELIFPIIERLGDFTKWNSIVLAIIFVILFAIFYGIKKIEGVIWESNQKSNAEKMGEEAGVEIAKINAKGEFYKKHGIN